MDSPARARRVTRWLAATPSLAVAAGWVGIWLLWPGAAPHTARLVSRSIVSVCRLAEGERAHRKPDLFGPPSTLGFSPVRREAESWQAPRARRPLPPALLGRDAAAGALRAGDAGNAQSVGDAAPDYAPVFGTRALYRETPAQNGGLHVRVSPALSAAGFAWPLAELQTNGVPAVWDVEMTVEVDGRGRPRAVFVARGSGLAEVDRRVENLLMRGAATNAPPAGVCGTVSVSAGR